MDSIKLASQIEHFWAESVIPTLSEFIKIPAKNAVFDAQWQNNKHLECAANLVGNWISEQQLLKAMVEVIALKDKTPFLYAEIPGSSPIDKTILFYGHLDKMPESEGWTEGYSPWKPVLDQDRLYGRGASDNGCSPFIAVAALKALEQQSIPHARCIFLFECGEENGSPDFSYYIERLKEKIGNPDLIICLDSGGDDFERLWITNSIRGSITATLSVAMLQQAIHSGSFGGITASTFRIIRQLLARIENADTGELLLPELRVEVPAEHKEALKIAAEAIGTNIIKNIPLLSGSVATSSNPEVLLHRQTWGSSLAVIGANGLPPIEQAGNVIRPFTTLQLNLRIPPIVKAERVSAALKKTFETDHPYGAKVSFTTTAEANGWVMPKMSSWLSCVINNVAKQYFKGQVIYRGEGGAIHPISILSNKFAKAQFVVMGTNCVGANIHGPDEFLHLPTAKKLSCAVAHILAEHYKLS
ncbi:Peptidase M20 [Gammaproteobacteria bacterium]